MAKGVDPEKQSNQQKDESNAKPNLERRQVSHY